MHIHGWPGYVDQAGPTLRAPPVSASSSEIKMCTYPNFENYICVCVYMCVALVCVDTPLCLLRSENSFRDSVVSLHHMSPRMEPRLSAFVLRSFICCAILKT